MTFSAGEGRRLNQFHPDFALFQIPTFHISVDQSASQSNSLSDQGFQTSKALTNIKVEGQEASKQFKEGGDTHEPKSTTTTTTTVPKPHKF